MIEWTTYLGVVAVDDLLTNSSLVAQNASLGGAQRQRKVHTSSTETFEVQKGGSVVHLAECLFKTSLYERKQDSS